ncbi:3-hydroxyacyl-CoA dehydrogenase family protein [Bacteroidota bacterium]
MSEVIIEAVENYGLSQKKKPKALFSKVGIVGCGTVGQNIARMISRSGMEVIFIELSDEKIQHAIDEIEMTLDGMIDHWGMTNTEKRIIMSRIHGSIDYKKLKGCDIVIDAIKSKTREMMVEERKVIFRNIEKHVDPETIIATNSTTTVITELSSELKHNDRCVSLHFSTTTPDANIIEVVKGLFTSKETYERVKKFTKLLQKVAIPVEESPGLISVRLYSALVNEACEVLMEGVGTKEDIDRTIKNSFGLRLGPFEMADKIGIDKLVRWLDNLYREFGNMKYKASPILKKLLRSNNLGRRTGMGFYKYDEKGKKIGGNDLMKNIC